MRKRIEDTFSISGVVVSGDQRGRELGFPTANVPVEDATTSTLRIMRDGVYVTWFERENGSRLLSTTSVGHRPTFYGKDAVRLIEVHVLDFSGDLYGEQVQVHFQHRLRPQRAFDDITTLVTQLELDVAKTRDWAIRNNAEAELNNAFTASASPQQARSSA